MRCIGNGTQDKGKEVAFFDAHADSDEYDVFTPQANERLIAAFKRLSGLPRRRARCRSRLRFGRISQNCCGARAIKASVSTSARNWSRSDAANIPASNLSKAMPRTCRSKPQASTACC